MLNLNFEPFPVLTTGQLILRQLRPGDAREIFSLRTDEQVNKYIDRPKTRTIDEALQFIDKINAGIGKNESIYWAISLKPGPKLVGTICYWNISKEKQYAEIGYELHPDFQGKGIMQEAFQQVIRFGFENMHLEKITAFSHRDNNSSLKLLEKNKFNRDEKLEQELIDEIDNCVIYSLSKTLYRTAS